MPITIPAFLRNPRITGIVRSADVPSNYIMSQWFPMEDVDADEFESLVQLDEVHLAPFVALDAETPRMPDDILGSTRWSVAYIRYKKVFKESDLRVFFEPGVNDPNSLTAANARAAERKIRRYVDMLSQSIDARLEWMGMSAVTGSIAYNDTHVQYSVTYNGARMGSSNKKTATWYSGSPTPVTDLSNWIWDIGDLADHDSWTLITSQKVLGTLAQSQDVRQLWSNANRNPAVAEPASLAPLNVQMVAGALSMIGIDRVIRYNSKYTTRTEAAGSVTRALNRFLSEDDLLLLPTGARLGRMVNAPAEPNNWRNGKFGWSEKTVDPWVTQAGAGLYGWIDFPSTKWNSVLQATIS